MSQMLRIAMLAVAFVVAGAATLAIHGQHRPAPRAAQAAVTLSHLTVESLRAVPIESSGRVEQWENRRLLAAEAAAAAQAAADAKARAGRSGAQVSPAASTSIPSYPAGSIQDIITKAFAPLGATAVAWGLRVAKCESGYNPRAYNPAGPYYGLFQFLMSTFKATPYGSQDIYDPVANASAAAWKYSQGGAGAWGCR